MRLGPQSVKRSIKHKRNHGISTAPSATPAWLKPPISCSTAQASPAMELGASVKPHVEKLAGSEHQTDHAKLRKGSGEVKPGRFKRTNTVGLKDFATWDHDL